jgi:hypothetical protein
MAAVMTPKSDGPKLDGFGIWIGSWDLVAAFALLAAAFLMVRLEAVQQLAQMAVNKDYFGKTPLLLDASRHGYSFETVRNHLHALGEDGRAYYAHSFLPIYDVALSLFLLTFSILFILYATQQDRHYSISLPGWLRRVLVIGPIMQFLFDVGENLSLRQLLEEFPRISQKLVEAASQMTQAKWLMIYANTLILVALAAFTIYRWFSPAETTAAGK